MGDPLPGQRTLHLLPEGQDAAFVSAGDALAALEPVGEPTLGRVDVAGTQSLEQGHGG
jgi:hypothetical protein